MEADGSWVASALPTVAPLRLTIRRRCASHVHQNNGLNLQHLFRGAHASRGVSRAVFGVSPNTVFGRDAPAPVPLNPLVEHDPLPTTGRLPKGDEEDPSTALPTPTSIPWWWLQSNLPSLVCAGNAPSRAA